jgi:peroxiredoxin
MSIDALPADLPVPVDDGACDHLAGAPLPALVLESSRGPVDLRELGRPLAVLYVYPRTGKPGVPANDEWNAIPGARGCTPQSCAFRDHESELGALGAALAGLSSQPLEEQVELARRLALRYPVIADPELRLAAALELPTFEFASATLYRRVTLVLEAGRIAKAFYPVFPPDRNPEDVIAWLAART